MGGGQLPMRHGPGEAEMSKPIWCGCCGRLALYGGLTAAPTLFLSWEGVAVLRAGVCVCHKCLNEKVIEEWKPCPK